MVKAIETLRLYVLFLSVPITLIWATALGWPVGPLLVGAHTCLIIFGLTYSAKEDVTNAINPRLALAPDREDFSRSILETAPRALGLALFVLIFWLMWVDFAMALLLAIGAAAAIHDARLPITRKNILIEIAGPAILIVGPAALLRVRGILDVDAFGASLLASVMLGLCALVCLVRDRDQDEAVGALTTATRVGSAGGVAIVALWALIATALAAVGTSAGWWGAWPSLTVSWTMIVAMTALASNRAGWATSVALIGGALLSMQLFAATT